MRRSELTLAIVLGGALALSALQAACATPSEVRTAAVTAPSEPLPHESPQSADLAPNELEQVVAPVALYPDALLAQVLAASTFPIEVVEADRWMHAHSALAGPSRARAVDRQGWDPSIKALTEFPVVLSMMDRNLTWTSALGEAYLNEPQRVFDAVQTMRRRAQLAGNLQSTPQETVADGDQEIVVQPTDPEVVYVPEYDPWTIYGASVAVYPGWVGAPPLFIDGYGIDFGLGIPIGYFADFPWGWSDWGADWHGHWLRFHDHPYLPRGSGFVHHRHFGVSRPGISFSDRRIPDGGFHPGGLSPGGFHPGGFHPGGFHPGGFHPGGFHPGGFHPGGLSPGGFHPGGLSPGGFHPGGLSPGGFHPGGLSPGGFHPGGLSPGGFHPGGFHPGGFPGAGVHAGGGFHGAGPHR
jgi:Protein of unknown function (DUF3300)